MLNNKTTSTLTILSAVAMMLVISTVSTKILTKESEVKVSNTIDSLSDRCYDNCIGIEPLVYESTIVKEIRQYKVDAIEKNRAAEDARKVELARVEAIRVSAILAENKRLADIEAEKLRHIEIEKKRLAKLDKQREINRLAKLEKKKQPMLASRGTGYQGKTQTYTATAYTAYCHGCSGITKTGINLRSSIYHGGRRVIAVDPNRIPLGSIVQVTLSDGSSFEATAQDTGGAIKGAIVDVAHETKADAYSFGRQLVKIRIIK